MPGKILRCMALLFISLPATAFAQGKTFYEDSKRGWYWYEQAPPKTEQGMKQNPEKALPAVSLRDYTDEQIWKMDADKFSALRDSVTKKAVSDPSNEESMGEYVKIIDITRRRSLAFANSYQAFLAKNPEYNIASASPLAAPGRVAVTRERMAEVSGRIRRAKDDFALIYFYRPDCRFCEEQAKILRNFAHDYSWEVKKVDISASPGTAGTFRITMTPALILVERQSGEHLTVSVGVASKSEIEDAVYRMIRLLGGEISPEEYSAYEFQRGGPFDVNAARRRQAE